MSEVIIEVLETGPRGPQGLPGTPGAQGASGGFYRHVQGDATTVWVIEHDLGFFPNVTVFDSAGFEAEGEVEHLDANTLEFRTVYAFSGEAFLS